MERPVVAVTIGDPAGIGPEIALKAAQSEAVRRRSVPVLIGTLELLQRCTKETGNSGIRLVEVGEPGRAVAADGQVSVINVSVPGLEDLRVGDAQPVGGTASDAYIRRACELALEQKVDALATAPISKESLRAAGIPEIGHTELLAKYLNADDPLTLFVTGRLRIFFLSRHLSLRQAVEYVTEERLLRMMRRVNEAMQKLGFPKPRMGVAALNPHASDGGQFGDEEARVISPAISKARVEGMEVFGPVSADAVFHQALEGRYDCVVALYHDQGHIAAKTRDFFGTVTATLGLPVLRTSVDHGTAFDIAWQGKANSQSMEAAILAACDLLGY